MLRSAWAILLVGIVQVTARELQANLFNKKGQQNEVPDSIYLSEDGLLHANEGFWVILLII